jgi:hypothetical protein
MQSLNAGDSPHPHSFLSDPDALLTQPIAVQMTIVNHLETPRLILEVLVKSDDSRVAEAAQLHVNWAGELGENEQAAIDAFLQTAQLGQNDRLAVELLKIAPVPPVFFSEWVPAAQMEGFKNPYMPLHYRLQWLERLAQEPTLEPRLQVAESPETPLSILEILVGDLELPVRWAAKSNPACPSALIELVEGQQTVASDWNTDVEQLEMLSQSRWGLIRLAVAKNPSASVETLMHLASDAVVNIQLAVAQNPMAPAIALAALANHPENAIQEAVAKHPNTPEEVLHQLFATQQRVLRGREALPASLLQRFFEARSREIPLWKNTDLQYFLTKQPNTSGDLLAELANVDLEEVRADLLTAHQPGSPEILENWVKNKITFLKSIASHPNTTAETLEQLAAYPDEERQLAVAQNLNTSEHLRHQILEQLVDHADDRIKVAIAKDLQTPVTLLEKMAGDSIDITRISSGLRAMIPSASPTLLNLLVNFCRNRGSTEQISFWLNQGKAFCDPILQEWHELMSALEESDRQILKSVKGQLSSAIRQQNGNPTWLIANYTLENYVLYGFLTFMSFAQSSDRSSQAVVAALLGNPNTPSLLRDRLWQQVEKAPDSDGSYRQDKPFRLALALNPSVSEEQRKKYLQQIFTAYGEQKTCEDLAQDVKTPALFLMQLALSSDEIVRYYVAKNISTPPEALAQLVQDSDIQVQETASKNPRVPKNQAYRQLLLRQYASQVSQAERDEKSKMNELLARRPDSAFALAQVVEKGDRNAKITAARSLKTPIAILEQLARDVDETVRSVVSENRNLPLRSLLELAQDASINIRANLARHRSSFQVPTLILERLAQDTAEQVRVQVASNPNTPTEILTQLTHDSSLEVCRALTQNTNAPEHILEVVGIQKGIVNPYNLKTPGNALTEAIERAFRGDFRLQDKAIDDILKNRNSQVPSETLERLTESCRTNWVRSSIAHHSNTPETALRKMAGDDYAPVLWGIARNPNASADLLEQLLDRSSPSPQDYQQLCGAMIERADLPLNIIERLLQTAGTTIRQRLVTRNNLSTTLINHLIKTEFDESILVSLARNPILSTDHLAQLVQHPNSQVCIALVNHPNLTSELLEQLSHHPQASVRKALILHSKCSQVVLEQLLLTELFDSSDALDNLQKIAAHPNVTLEMLTQLSTSSSAKIRATVASHPKTSLSLLEQLAQDEKVEVRRAVAQNPNTPASIREQLRDLIVKQYDRQPSPTLLSLPRLYNPQTDDLPTLLAEYAQSENAFVRFITLLHPLTPIEVLEQGARSLSWLERYAVAKNPATPSDFCQQFVGDSNRIVRAVVNP